MGARLDVESWFRANKLCLNSDKTVKITFTLKNHCKIEQNSVKFLGIHLDSRLSFATHIESVCKTLSKKMFLFRKLRESVSQGTLVNAYFGLVHSILSYGILIWGHSPRAAEVFSIQRRVIRIICNLNYRADCRQSFKDLNVLTVPCQYLLNALVYVKSNINIYTTQNNIHHYQTRSRNNIHIEFHRINRSRDASNYFAPNFYNRLPNEIKKLPLKQFKARLKKLLLTKAFYCLNEFLTCDLSL